MKLEIQVNVADDAADKVELQEHLRREAILACSRVARSPPAKPPANWAWGGLPSWIC